MPSLTVPSNANGVIFDQALVPLVSAAIAKTPFGFSDVYVYSHGWSTDADRAAIDYDLFSIGLMRRLFLESQTNSLPLPPREALELGVHWPSVITEDPTSVLNDLQLFTFFTMEQRADSVGKNLVYSLLRLALMAREGEALRFFLIGHSFGCKVICAALHDVQADLSSTIPISPATSWRVALLQAATDADHLEDGDIYGNVSKLANLRMVVTTSQHDLCLTRWYPEASRIANFFHHAAPREALGAVGPTAVTRAQFSTTADLAVSPGFTMKSVVATNAQLVVADLTPVHAARAIDDPAVSSIVCGSHSDIFFDELYNLIGGLFYS